MPFPDLNDLKPSMEDLIIIHKLEEEVLEAGYNLLNKINDIYDKDHNIQLQIATSESLTAGLIMSSLVNLPISGWAKYGCFGVYDTDAKRVFNSVQVDDVYTHTCAKEMALGILKNSNATFAISVTGNAMPWFNDLNKLGEVFICIAGYSNPTDPEIIYETRSFNNCLLGDNIKEKCNLWVESQPNPSTYAKRPETAAISRIIRNYTAILAMKFAVEFLDKYELCVPDFIKVQKDQNEIQNNKRHNNIPPSKYEKNLKLICKNIDNQCLEFDSNYGDRWDSKEFIVSTTGGGSKKRKKRKTQKKRNAHKK